MQRTQPLFALSCFLAFLGWTAPLAPAHADATGDASLITLRLRGGYDANPTLSGGGPAAPFTGFDAAFVTGSDGDEWRAGIVGEASRTQYFEDTLAPSEHYKSSFELANKGQGGLSLRSTSSVESTRNYQLRAFDAAQRLRVQWLEGSIRPFVTGEIRYATINETNAIFTDFLPEDQRYLRATAIPGLAIKNGNLEFGASVNLSVTRYADEYDLFGFRRDNERIQPFLFVRYESDSFDAFANISRFRGRWHDVDFPSVVDRYMMEASMTAKGEKLSLELSARQYAAETTFPISPILFATAFGAKLTAVIDEKNSATLFARDVATQYVNSPFSSRTRIFGATFDHKLADDLVLGLELVQSRGSDLLDENAHGFAGTLSVSKKFQTAGAPKKQAAALPPEKVGGMHPLSRMPYWRISD